MTRNGMVARRINNTMVLGFQREMGEDETEAESEEFAAQIEAVGWRTGESLLQDGVEFISVVKANGEPIIVNFASWEWVHDTGNVSDRLRLDDVRRRGLDAAF